MPVLIASLGRLSLPILTEFVQIGFDLGKNPRFHVVIPASFFPGAAVLPKSSIADDDLSAAIRPYQLAAIASPHCPTSELVGNFGDIDGLFDQLSEPVVIELGKPLPKKKYLPKKRAGSCPAAHNRALLGEAEEDQAGPSQIGDGGKS